MKGLDTARNAIGEFDFHEFRLLRELRVSVTPRSLVSVKIHPVVDVEICLETESRQPPARICLRFSEVRSLQIQELGGEACIHGFDVVDVSDRQLEGISWYVHDYEESVISFWSKDAEVLAASAIAPR